MVSLTFEQFEEKVLEGSFIPSYYIVRIRYKYSWENSYTISNEIYYFDDCAGCWCWFNDWYEGQDIVEVVGFVADEDIIVEGVGT